MSMQDGDVSWVLESIVKANSRPSSTVKIHTVPRTVTREKTDYDKYYVPKVVSIGPYHFGNPKLKLAEKLKPVFTNELLSNIENLERLCKTLGEPELVRELRAFYEESSTDKFSDKEFTKMMLLDGCFVLYYIHFLYGAEEQKDFLRHQAVFIHEDLFLLDNQIPLRVLTKVMEFMKVDYQKMKEFIYDNILASGMRKRRWFELLFGALKAQRYSTESNEDIIRKAIPKSDHLLHLLHQSLIEDKVPNNSKQKSRRCTFRNVNELADVGIHFEPSGTMSLDHVVFRKSWWHFSAKVELPPISVDDSTKPILLNLIAYEMCSHSAHESWVTSYICLLDSLIDHPEDVRTLRKVGVLENSLGSDQEVAKVFNEIGTDLVPNSLAYLDVKNKMQRHYDSWRNSLLSQLKHEYVKSPWAFLALLGAFLALFLSGVQTYYTVWSPEGQCDDLCKLLKRNHHL